MINNLLKVSALIVTGKFLKPRFKGLICLILFWLLVSFLHREYISYVELSENTDFVLEASLLKIVLYLASLGVYLIAVEHRLLINAKPKQKTSKPMEGSSDQEPIKGSQSERNQAGDDGFNFLRSKKNLKSSEEKLLGK